MSGKSGESRYIRENSGSRYEDGVDGEEIIRIIPARKLISVSAESVLSKPLNKRQKSVLARIANRQAAGRDSGIDYSDILRLTDKQLARFRRARN